MELKWIKENKIPVIFILAFLVCMVIVWTAYNLYGHQFIQTIYEDKSIEFFNKIFEGRGTTPLEVYLVKADRLFSEIMSLIFTFFFLLLAFFLLIKLSKAKYQKPHPIEWFYLIAGLFLTQWYFWFMDDAFIYFRYIDNLLFLNLGLVYNQGEYVDGLSSPGWALFLALLRSTKVSFWFALRLVAAVSFVLFWFMLVQLNGKLSPKTTVINFPLAYLVCNYAVVSYFSGGLETPIVHVLAIAYALYILNPSSKVLQILLALSPLIRHELILPLVLCSLWAWRYHKEFPLKMIIMAAIFIGSWVVFRIYYYADLLPNTFYLKNVFDIKQGFVFVHQVLRTYHFYIVALIFVLLIILLKKKHVQLEPAKRLMMVITATPVVLYVIKIGGDAMHYKYLAFPFVLTVCAFSGVLEYFFDTFRLNKYKLLKPLTGVMVSLAVFFLYPPQIASHPFFINVEVKPVNKIYEAAKHRQRDFSKPLHWGEDVNVKIMQEYKNKNKRFKYEGTERAQGCFRSYLRFYKRIIHGLGLTEPILARTEMEIDSPAHKLGLKHLGDDIVFLHDSSKHIGKGMYRKAVEEGRAPEWIRKNLETIEIVERKIYNTHNFWENLRLAFTFPPKIKP